jgi:hypothetical protein
MAKKDLSKLVKTISKWLSIDEFSKNYQILGNREELQKVYDVLLEKGIKCHLSEKFNRVLYIEK